MKFRIQIENHVRDYRLLRGSTFPNLIIKFRFMVFNNISVISWLSVLLVEETGENHQPVASH